MSIANTSYQPTFDLEPESAVPDWKAELNAKLVAHRQRRPSAAPPGGALDPAARDLSAAAGDGPRLAAAKAGPATPQAEGSRGERPASASLVAARVAERYAKAPSYSEFLAASAAAAAAAAETAAFAASQAQDAADSLARLTAAQAARDLQSAQECARESAQECARAFDQERSREDSQADFRERSLAEPTAILRTALPIERRPTVEHPEPLPPRGIVPPRTIGGSRGLFDHAAGIVDAFAEAMVPAAISLPAKLIEFPRELIAAHRSRPRIAEGPLVEERPPDESASSALRIFEVDGEADGKVEGGASAMAASRDPSREPRTDAASSAYAGSFEDEPGRHEPLDLHPSGRTESSRAAYSTPSDDELAHRAPAWHSIRLGEHPSSEQAAHPYEDQQRAPATQLSTAILHTATLSDRTMAALVDGCLVAGAFAIFVLVFVSCAAHPPAGRAALVSGLAILGALLLFYEWLFMSYGAGTPGMRYARIGICTFADENPTRTMMRKRVAASVLSALALGLGFLWALFDQDALTWHDRMTRTYQRSCR